MAIFPAGVLVAYGVLYLLMPDRTVRAVVASAQVLTQVALPLCMAFVLMVVLNLFVKPAHVFHETLIHPDLVEAAGVLLGKGFGKMALEVENHVNIGF